MSHLLFFYLLYHLLMWLVHVSLVAFCFGCTLEKLKTILMWIESQHQQSYFNLFLQRSCNAAQSLCDVIRLSRDHMSQLQENADQDPLLDAVQRYHNYVCWVELFHPVCSNFKDWIGEALWCIISDSCFCGTKQLEIMLLTLADYSNDLLLPGLLPNFCLSYSLVKGGTGI